MGESYGQLATDGIGRKVPSRQRVIGANTVEETRFIKVPAAMYDKPLDDTDFSGLYYLRGSYVATTFATLGNAATTHVVAWLGTLSTAFATPGQGFMLGLRHVEVQMDAVAVALTGVAPQVGLWRGSNSSTSGGTALTATPLDSDVAATTSLIKVLGATASDGGGATVITSSGLDSRPMSQGYIHRTHDISGQFRRTQIDLLPAAARSRRPARLLNPNIGMAVVVTSSAGASNPTTNQWQVRFVWDEWVQAT